MRIDIGSGFGLIPGIFAQDDFEPFLGEDFFPWMILAFGAAMVIGNVLALLRPPPAARESDGRGSGSRANGNGADGDPPRPPLGRSVVMIVAGLAAAAWGLASLLS